MKKLFLLSIFLITFGTSGYSQDFGVMGGGLLTNIQWRNTYFTLNTVPKPGFVVGLSLDIPLSPSFTLNTALNYKWVGAAFLDTANVDAIRLGYANLDITVNYIFDGNKVRPYVEGGTYLAYLAHGEKVQKEKDQDPNYEDLKIGSETTDDIIPFDFGWAIGGGVYYKKWKFGIGYQASVINLSPQDDLVLRNKSGYLRVTYFFNKKLSEE